MSQLITAMEQSYTYTIIQKELQMPMQILCHVLPSIVISEGGRSVTENKLEYAKTV